MKPDASLLAGIPATLAPLIQAEKLQDRAARHGFDWPETEPLFAKVEELEELRAAWSAGDRDHMSEELGDLLFLMVNLARHLGMDAETALRGSNRKSIRRFRYMEQRLAEAGRAMGDTPLAELDALWEDAKRSDRT